VVSIAEDRIWVEATTGYTMAVVEADIVEALDEAPRQCAIWRPAISRVTSRGSNGR